MQLKLRNLAITLFGVILANAGLFSTALADPPHGQNNSRNNPHESGEFKNPNRTDRGQGNKHDKHDVESRKPDSRHTGEYSGFEDVLRSYTYRFSSQQRHYLSNYYHDLFSRGDCPPGLARKNNGCMPPGQAKWRLGYPLPSDVRYYELPADVLTQLGSPPRGYRYVRVADDILLLSVGTNLVIDALTNLSR